MWCVFCAHSGTMGVTLDEVIDYCDTLISSDACDAMLMSLVGC